MEIKKTLKHLFTSESREAESLKQGIIARSEATRKRWERQREEIKELTVYKIAKSSGNL